LLHMEPEEIALEEKNDVDADDGGYEQRDEL
jgi:hypothetical protein